MTRLLETLCSDGFLETTTALLRTTEIDREDSQSGIEAKIREHIINLWARVATSHQDLLTEMAQRGILSICQKVSGVHMRKLSLLPVFVKVLLNREEKSVSGNALLVLSEFAKTNCYREQLTEETLMLRLLGKEPLRSDHSESVCLDIARHGNEGIGTNAGICLARMAEHPVVLDFIRKHHGIEILHKCAGQLKQ